MFSHPLTFRPTVRRPNLQRAISRWILSALLVAPSISAAEELYRSKAFTVNATSSDGTLAIELKLTSKGTVTKPFLVDNPDRLVVDLPGVRSEGSPTKSSTVRGIGKLRIGSDSKRTRVVFDLSSPPDGPPSSTITSTSVSISQRLIGATSKSTPIQSPSPSSTTVASPIPTKTPTPSPSISPSPSPQFSSPTAEPTSTPAVKTTQPALIQDLPDELLGGVEPPTEGKRTISAVTVDAITFESIRIPPVPVVALSLAMKKDYPLPHTFSKQGSGSYLLTIENASLRSELLTLAQFPPDNFSGFETVQASEQDGDVKVEVFVEDGTKLQTFVADGRLYIRVTP